MSYIDDYTEKKLKSLEKKLARHYKSAWLELDKKAKDYFDRYKERYEEQKRAYEQGKYTKQEWINWQTAQLARGKHWTDLRDDMAKRLANASSIASEMINKAMPSVFAECHNYELYRLGQFNNTGISFELLDENTVRRLMDDGIPILPKKSIDMAKAQAWNMQKIQNALLQGIAMGDSIYDIAKRFQNVSNMNQASAIRNARTSFTGAQNAGRQESYRQAKAMGIDLQKEWISASDNRVRDSHARLDGIRVDYDDKFPNGLMFPGDPSGTASEVYNCRCTMGAVLPGYANEKAHKTGNTADGYRDWKLSQKPMTYTDATARFVDGAYGNQYKKLTIGNETKENVDGIIKAHKIANSNCGMYISDKVEQIKPKMYTQIDKNMKSAMDLVGVTNKTNAPTIVIVDDSEMKNTSLASYNPIHNLLKVRASLYVDYSDKCLMPNDVRVNYIHELLHWKDAQEYQKNKNIIINTKENYANYIEYLNKRAHNIIKANVDYDYSKISLYAQRCMGDKRYNEVITEHRTMEIIKNALTNSK